MIYNKFGKCAIKAYELMKQKNLGEKAWEVAAKDILGDGTSASQKGCPKNAFLGLFGYRDNKNASYAKRAVILLDGISENDIVEMKPSKFWKKVMKMEISHNSQIDVVFALRSKGYI